MKVSDIYGSKFLKSEELKGKPITTVIEDAEVEEVKGQDGTIRPRIILQLKDVAKRLIINATNAGNMSEAFGDDTDEWIGRTIKVGVHKVLYAGKKVDGIYVEPQPAVARVS